MNAMARKCAALAGLVLLAACGGGGGGGDGSPTAPYSPSPSPGPTLPAVNEVIATPSNTFTPSTLTVARGTTVTFTFQGTTHNVNFANVAGAPANIAATANSGVQRVFSTAGTFGYDCSLHSGMSGTIVVN
jgi:plastocyanin